MPEFVKAPSVIIGLGNPDNKFFSTRHNIGFTILDALVSTHGGNWQFRDGKEIAALVMRGYPVLAVKPMTYMNNSGDIVPFLKMKDIQASDCLVIHDELEKPFGKVSLKWGGSARGHNGLKSLIERWGTDEFGRLRFGIGRPDSKEAVPRYVLEKFENPELVSRYVQEALMLIEDLYKNLSLN